MRIALIGGTDFVEEELEDFLYALHSKHPEATIITGNGRGAEQAVKRLLEAIGHTVEVPPLHTEFKHPKTSFSPTDHQVATIIEGDYRILLNAERTKIIGSEQLTPRADVIVIIGNPDSSRARKAADIYKKMDAWRDKKNRRVLHYVAAPVKKIKPKTYRATKKNARIAA